MVKLSKKKYSIVFLFSGLITLILINIIAAYAFFRIDLTHDNRYTLKKETKKILKQIDDIVYFKIYIDGNLPAGLKRMQQATKELLDDFRYYAGDNIEYEFIDPFKGLDEKTKKSRYKQLLEQGLEPTELKVKKDDGFVKRMIFPGAIVTYNGKSIPVQLLKQQIGMHPEVVLNNSIQNLEYAFVHTLAKLTNTLPPKIAFIEGHGELNKLEVADIINELQTLYKVNRTKIDGKIENLLSIKKDGNKRILKPLYELIIIAKPDSQFAKKDKVILDQYLMQGGKILWLIDHVYANMDSLRSSPVTTGMPISETLNLYDQLFTYGIRINADLVQDMQAAAIPLNVAPLGAQSRYEMFPWYYFPLLFSQNIVTDTSNFIHPISKNLNAIKSEFASTIDFADNKNIKKTILLTTSPYTKVLMAPMKISFNIVNKKPNKRNFSNGKKTIAALLEGSFVSNFKNRLPKLYYDSLGFDDKSKETKMIVISDGDIIKNFVHQASQTPYPLGYDRFTKTTYGNKDFILNCINYLAGNENLITVRQKEFILRMLNKEKIQSSQLKWQIINVVLPIIIICLFGIAFYFIRQKKYS